MEKFTVKYSEYKNNESLKYLRQVEKSYDARSKTIDLFLPATMNEALKIAVVAAMKEDAARALRLAAITDGVSRNAYENKAAAIEAYVAALAAVTVEKKEEVAVAKVEEKKEAVKLSKSEYIAFVKANRIAFTAAFAAKNKSEMMKLAHKAVKTALAYGSGEGLTYRQAFGKVYSNLIKIAKGEK
jgi:hypothetical protein